MSLLATLEQSTAADTEKAMTEYRRLVHAEVAGEATADETKSLRKCLAILSLSAADFADDVRALRDVSALPPAVDDAEVDKLREAHVAACKNEYEWTRPSGLRDKKDRELSTVTNRAAVAWRSAQNGNASREKELAKLKASAPRIFAD